MRDFNERKGHIRYKDLLLSCAVNVDGLWLLGLLLKEVRIMGRECVG